MMKREFFIHEDDTKSKRVTTIKIVGLTDYETEKLRKLISKICG